MSELTTALVQSSLPEWIQVLTLIFGGCCSNVWALESLLKHHPGSGTFLTFSQFLFVTVQNLPKFLEFRSAGEHGKVKSRSWLPRWKKREVPLKRWMGQVLLFLGISLRMSSLTGESESKSQKLINSKQLRIRPQGNCFAATIAAWTCPYSSSVDTDDPAHHLP